MDLSLNKLPWYAQVGMFVALALAMVGVFYQFYVVPTQAEMATRETTLNGLRADIAKGSSTAAQLNQFRQQVAELEGRLESLKAVLPEQKDVADLLRRIQTLATQSNLAIRGFKPEPSVTKQLHAEWPIKLQLDGTYHNLAMFFDRVSKFSRIINVSAISIHGKEKPLADSTITVDCTATTFVLLEAAKPARQGRRTDETRQAHTVVLVALLALSGAWLVSAQGAPSRRPCGPSRRRHGTGTAAPAAGCPKRIRTTRPGGGIRSSACCRAEPMPGPARKATGLSSLATSDLMLRGVLQSRSAYVALVSGPDGKTYSARANDRLLDGVIRSVTPQGIVIMQEVNDPLSLVKQREVRKGLRNAEDAK